MQMYISFSEWSKNVRKALVDKETNLQEVAKESGYCYTTVSALVSGRIAKDNYQDVARQINAVLGIEGIPEKPPSPPDEWTTEVRVAMVKKKMTVGQLAKSSGFNRDRVSLVINGHSMDEPVIKEISRVLEVEPPVFLDEPIIAESEGA